MSQSLRLSYYALVCRCEITGGAEDGCTVMDQASLQLDSCHIHANKGPAMDISGHAAATAVNSSLHDNAGTTPGS